MTRPSAATAKPTISRHRWAVLGLLLLVYLVNFMDRQLFAVLQERIAADLQFEDWQLGLLGGTMFAVFYATLGVPLAWFADRTHRVRLIAGALAIWSVFTALSGLTTSFLQMALARIGVATGEAGGVSPSYSVLSDYFGPGQRGLAIGVFSIGAPLGLMVGTLLGAWIADALSWRWAFILLGLPGLLLAGLLILVVSEPRRGAMDPTPARPRPPAQAMDALRHLLATPSLLFFTGAAAFTSLAGYGLYQWIPSFLQRSQGMELDRVGTLLGPLFALGILGSIGGGWLADRLGQRHPGAYGFVPAGAQLLAAPFFLAALLTPHAGATLAFLALPTALSYVWIGPTLAATQNLSSPAIRASVAALIAFFNNLIGFGLGPLLVGALSTTLTPSLGAGEALRMALIAATSVYLVGALMFLAAARTLRADLAAARL